MNKIAIVSLCNKHSWKQNWFPLCVGTWHNLLPGVEKFFVSDGSLACEQKREIELLSGGTFIETEEFKESLQTELKKYPAISKQRKLCVFYRRIIDFSIYFKNYEHLLSVDTDIGILSTVQLPSTLPDFAFCVDDVSGYSVDPNVAFQEKIVAGLNAGFLLFRPKIIDFDFIEYVTEKYISKGKINWWAEQTCWALIAANLSSNTAVFSPDSVAIVSGLKKRSFKQIRNNKTSYFKKSVRLNRLHSVEEIIGNANVIHFGGPGKPWIQPIMGKHKCATFHDRCQINTIEFEPLPNHSILEKFFLFLYLLSKKF